MNLLRSNTTEQQYTELTGKLQQTHSHTHKVINQQCKGDLLQCLSCNTSMPMTQTPKYRSRQRSRTQCDHGFYTKKVANHAFL